MVTDTLIKKYNLAIEEVLKVGLTNETKSLIRKFDARYKIQINRKLSLQQEYFKSTNFTKNQRLISHLFLKISSAWFCYEVLILICTEFDSQNNLILLKGTQKKGNEFRDNFLKESGFKDRSQNIVNEFYKKSVSILDKISNHSLKMSFLSETKKILNTIIQSNIKAKKTEYNFAIEDFSSEVSEIERICKANYKKTKNREDYICKHLDFKCFIGFCFALRNQYVHNGLVYNLINNNDKLYVETLENINHRLNHLVLTLAVNILKTMHKGKIENQSDEENN